MRFLLALRRPLAAASLSFALLAPIAAQASPPPSHWEHVAVRSGALDNPLPVEVVVWSQFVLLPVRTPWLRLHYHHAHLPTGSYLRITSVLDGATMLMRGEHLAQWQNTSCYFNGAAVLVELVAGPNTQGNEIDIQRVVAGDVDGVQPASICGTTDNRAPTTEPRAGRIDPVGCTGWIIDVPAGGPNKVHLSAGHCTQPGQVLQFDVPASTANCSLVFPPPAKQFAIDTASSVWVDSGPGNDYWAFRCYPNSTTGRTTFQEQGSAFTLASQVPALSTTLRMLGYGVDGTDVNSAPGGNNSCSCSPGSGTGTRNQTQQAHVGPLANVLGNRLDYPIDSCGGTSGGVVYDVATGQAVAIHTHGACHTSAATNWGTSIRHPAVQAAISAVTPPNMTNDACANAVPLTLGVNGTFANIGATQAGPAISCGAAAGRDVWFSLNSCGGAYTISTCTPARTLDTVLQVFSGGCAAPVLVACNDDAGGACGTGSRLDLTLAAGTYLVRVAGNNQATGFFDVVVEQPPIYDAGPLVTDPVGGPGGAPISVVQTFPPHNMSVFGFDAYQAGPVSWMVADDFMTHGAWCITGLELFAFQDGATTPSISGVYVEIYDDDPNTFGVPVAGSPGFTNNLFATPGYRCVNRMTGIYRVPDVTPTDASRHIQSVSIGFPAPLTLDSSTVPSGRFWLAVQFTGSPSPGPFAVPMTISNSTTTGDGMWGLGGTWAPLADGGRGQGLPFRLFGSSPAAPGEVVNLGGSCSTATLEARAAPHVGGVLHFELVNSHPLAIPGIVLGLSDPNSPFAPFCSCVQHASLDLIFLGPVVNWQVPTVAAGLGFEIQAQGLQMFAPSLACDIGIGFRFELTDGWRVRLY